MHIMFLLLLFHLTIPNIPTTEIIAIAKKKNYIGLLGCTQYYQIDSIDFSQAHLYHINLKYLEVFKKSVFSLKHKRIIKFTQWLISVIFSKQSCLMIQASIQKSVFNIQWGFFVFFPNRLNVGCGPAEERILLTGLHAVADIYCESCKTTLGWKYVSVIYFISRKLERS